MKKNYNKWATLFGNQSFDLITADSFRIRSIIDGILNDIPVSN